MDRELALPRAGRSPYIATPSTVIEFLLDETGSMNSCKNQTVSGFNTFLKEQKEQTDECLFTLTKFDTAGQKTPYVDIDVNMVPLMMPNWFNPGGGTNLRDTIGRRISSLNARLSKWTVKPNVLFIVMTDGEDNASSQYSEQAIQSLIKSYTMQGWTFVYLGANQNAMIIANRLGFPDGNIKSFATDQMEQTMQTVSAATVAYRSTRTTSTQPDTDFFGGR